MSLLAVAVTSFAVRGLLVSSLSSCSPALIKAGIFLLFFVQSGATSTVNAVKITRPIVALVIAKIRVIMYCLSVLLSLKNVECL
jgi:hypothetical protein